MSDHLHHKMAALHQSLLHGKLPRNLHWTDALELIGHLGDVESPGGDEFVFVIGAQRESFKRPRTPEFGVEDVSRLRKFLKEAAAAPASVPPVRDSEPSRMVVVIDHHAAHVYRDLVGSRPTDEVTIEPYDPHHFHHHLVHRKEAHYEGDRVPEETSFYQEVAAALLPADQIVLIGHGTGKSSALEALLSYLKKHHAAVAGRINATVTADLSALTEPEIETLAKQHLPGLR